MRLAIGCLVVLAPCLLQAQGTAADYKRAQESRTKYQGLAVGIPGPANWIEGTDKFWYTKSVKGGGEVVLVDAATQAKGPAFDHEKLATALNAAAGQHYTAITLPFASAPAGRGGGAGRGGAGSPTRIVDGGSAITFAANGGLWRCTLTDYTCKRTGDAPAFGGRGARGGGPQAESPWVSEDEPWAAEFIDDVQDGMSDRYAPPQAQAQQQQGQGRGGRGGQGGRGNTQQQQNQVTTGFGPIGGAAEPEVRKSPDEKWDALIQNFNVFLRPAGSRQAAEPLSWDGSEGQYYTLASISWSPDSKHLVAYRVLPGYKREVYYVESSPTDQLQPKHFTRVYDKPGDTRDVDTPVLFDVAAKKQTVIDNNLFPNPYDISRAIWWKDNRGFTFEYNQRGHQVLRLIEVSAATGKPRTLIEETSKTFIDYRRLNGNRTDTGKIYRYDVDDGKEIVWASERDGWEHLYLYDGLTGQLKNQITKGDWVVRAVDRVDPEKRQIWFQASGMDKGKDPYFTQYFRVNFDGTGLTRFTDADGNHTVTFSPDGKYYVDAWSRVDLPTMSQLRRTDDQKAVMDLEKGDASAAMAAGWKVPEVFTAMARDGRTDIWGVIYRPSNFDPSKKYPVIENIYAGPQGSFVPKDFALTTQAFAELGFIVVQMDGMGTNNRSRAFHDVAFKDLADAGFPDRILWHKAVAAKYPWYDISRVGIMGTSAGGQNAMGALVWHPEFYKAAVANSGCHDNRMDKMWWNEQWMGWPIGPQYAASSNMENAYRMGGNLLLLVGELDTNVDPSSTYQVINQLIKHNKKFDLLFVPGGGHGVGSAGAFVPHLEEDFFVHHLLGVEPPAWTGEPEQSQ